MLATLLREEGINCKLDHINKVNTFIIFDCNAHVILSLKLILILKFVNKKTP